MIKVLIVDDSIVFRKMLENNLKSDAQIKIVGTASHPYEAVEIIESESPDVITCDIHMPRMDGIRFIKQLLPQYPVPIIVISGVSESVFDALNAGAVDFIAKPQHTQTREDRVSFIQEIVEKIKTAARSKVVQNQPPKVQTPRQPSYNSDENKERIIAIGASTGGTDAIFKVLKALPSQIPGVLVVQHIPPMFSKMFADRLNNSTVFDVFEAKDGMQIKPGQVLIAPGDAHMTLVKSGSLLKVKVFQAEKVNGHCPSVDVLFQSVSKIMGDMALGVILTGMGYDGAKGLLNMKRHGAVTLGQDEYSSVVYGMPKAAYDIGAVKKQLALDEMPQGIMNWVKNHK